MASTLEASAWRVDRKKWESQSFSGRGASLEGGRWNSAGVPVVYASEHLAMAAQEMFIHLPRPLPKDSHYVKFRIGFEGLRVTRLVTSDLPRDWRAEPLSGSTQKLGDVWVLAARTAILAVPSALYPEETNFVFNPLHPDFKKIKIAPPEAFAFDPRMARLVEPGKA